MGRGSARDDLMVIVTKVFSCTRILDCLVAVVVVVAAAGKYGGCL